MHRGQVELRGHLLHVLRVLGNHVVLWIDKPIRGASANNIRGEHPVCCREALGQCLKVLAHSGQTMHADQHLIVVWLTPLMHHHPVRPGWAPAVDDVLLMSGCF